MAFAADHLLDRDASPLPATLLLGVGLCVTVLFVGGQYLLPSPVLALLPVVASIGVFLLRSGKAALYAFIIVALGLAFRMKGIRTTDPLDVLVGAALASILVGWTIKIYLFERGQITDSRPQFLLAFYMAWTMVIGFGGILWYNNTWNDWIRELLVQCPLFIIPALYLRSFQAGSRDELMLQRFAFGTAITLMVWTVVKYAMTLATALYAYQIGRLTFDTSTAIIVLLLCIAFTLYRVEWIPMWARVALSSFCVGTMVLSGYRTMWAATALGTLILFAIVDRRGWGKAIGFLTTLFLFLAGLSTYLFHTLPIFKIYVLMTTRRLLSTADLGTDPSLVNRYIETDTLWRHFLNSPIVGFGYGARYQNFDWLMGVSYDTGYAHNGFLFIAFKAGIIGAMALYVAYIWFMFKGLKLARDVSLEPRVRAIAAVGFCYLICMLINNFTLNIFTERNQLIWVALFWGFFLAQEFAQRKRRASETPSVIATA